MGTARIKSLAGVVAIVVASVGFTASARADFSVFIDACSPSGLPTWWSTPNAIKVEVKLNNVWNDVYTWWSGFPAYGFDYCQADSFPFLGWSWQDVQAIRISTNGTNAFWMDRVLLRDYNNWTGVYKTKVVWGVNNNIGYCLSTQASDGNSSYCYQNIAAWGWEFTP